MKHIWLMALCAAFVLLGCQSEKEEVAQPQLNEKIAKESGAVTAKAASAPKNTEVAAKVTEAEEVVEAAGAAVTPKALEEVKVVEVSGAAVNPKATEAVKSVQAAKNPELPVMVLPPETAIAATTSDTASSQAVRAGDAAKGKKQARRCKSCHTFGSGGRHMTGPNLFGIYGRTAGKVDGFGKYGNHLKDATFKWDEKGLLAWVCNSKEAIKVLTGNPAAKSRMVSQKKCGTDGQDVVAYLKTLK